MTSIRHAVLALSVAAFTATAGADSLQEGFANPPNSARPRVWWHWMNGNVTQDGIAKDLDWMQRTGIGGLQNFDANLRTPQIVDKRLVYMTPEWKQAFRFAVSLAEEKGLEFAIAASPGWSETGGPWVKPEDGIKKLVWSETIVKGGRRLALKLPAPPSAAGPFQDVVASESMSLSDAHPPKVPDYYADAAVVAYPVTPSTESKPTEILSSDGARLDASLLTDGKLSSALTLPRKPNNKAQVVTITYAQPQTIRSATLHFPGEVSGFFSKGLEPRLEASDGRGNWTKVADIALSMAPTTVAFAPVTARQFRIVFDQTGSNPFANMAAAPGVDVSSLSSLGAGAGGSADVQVAELSLSSQPRVNRFEAKAGFAIVDDYYALDQTSERDEQGVAPDSVIDLTARMREDGTLDWQAPQGTWRIVRFGASLTGKMNHPATAEATGLEVDKLDADAVRRYVEHYLAIYRDAAGADLLGARGVRALLTDSTEVGPFNWTPKMLEQFKRLRGYDPVPWLPTITGALVGSRRDSERFLYDFRRTIADLHATEHYGTLAEVAHEHGLKVYGEGLESIRVSLGNDIELRRFADYPMAALWTYDKKKGPLVAYHADMRGAASTAHLYGQNVVAAESMTSMLAPWAHAPSQLRPVIDLEFASGINRPVIHTSVHQPVDDKVPGLSLMIFGQYFNRHDAWAELAKPWVDYIARTSFMLQQGRNVADVAYFYGEEAPTISLYKDAQAKDAPRRYAYDFVNPHALLNVLDVAGSELVAKSGARYKLLYLGGSSQRMTLAALERIAQFVDAGAIVVGAAPIASPSLKDDANEFAALVKRLWGEGNANEGGKGKVIAARDVEAVLASLNVTPDFAMTNAADDSEVLFVHRKLDDGDLYYVNNRKQRAENIEARFRVTGKQPEIWRADTGLAEPVSYRTEGDGTVVPLELAAEESYFVVFRKPASAASNTVARSALREAGQLDGTWDVAFQPGRGAPASITLERLASLSEHADAGVKYFSGIATYRKQFKLPKGAKPGSKLVLDLGEIGDVAEVRVNGALVGSAWHAPYRVDIGKAVKAGNNILEIRVANRWVNRFIGDAQPGAQKITWTASPTYTAKAALQPAGLIGPVRLMLEP